MELGFTERNLDIDKITKIKDTTECGAELNNLYNAQSDKLNFITYLEYHALTKMKAKLNTDNRQLEQNGNSILLSYFAEKMLGRIKFIENWIEQKKLVTNEIEIPLIDLSDSSAKEKIIFLEKLGVIDFLRNKQPFNTSTNILANVLSAITGEKSGTLQPYVSAMISKNFDSKNHPMNSNETVKRVQSNLINIGFNVNETI